MAILLTQLTAPESTRWATVAQVRSRLSPAEVSAGGETLDDLLGDLLDEASAAATKVVGRELARAQYRQHLPGYGTDKLRLARGPLDPVGLILLLRGDQVDASLFIADTEHALLVRLDGQSWELTARYAGHSDPIPVGGDLSNDYTCTYWAGYRMPGQAPEDTGEPFPAELRAVVLGMVLSAYREPLRGGVGVKSLKKADRTVEFFQGSGGGASIENNSVLQDERDKVGP